ncbi:energy-coupling factor ABC transporter permease, partial [Aliarcobacter skirrowii]
AIPAYFVFLLFKIDILKKLNEKIRFFIIGFSGVFLSAIMMFILLVFSKQEYKNAAYSIVLVNIPTMILEGLITLFLFLYIKKTMPNLFKGLNI